MSAKDWRQDFATVAAAIAALAPGAGAAIADQRLLGNISGAPALATALTAAQVRTLLSLVAIATSGSGADLTAATVALSKVATQADQTILGNNTGGAASPLALTAAEAMAILQGGNNGACASYYTAELDFLATSSGNAFVPAKAGFYFVAAALRTFVTARTGSASTGTLTFQAGNDGSEVNLFPATSVAAATINTAAAPINPGGSGTNQSGTTAAATTGYTLKIVSALATATTCKGRIVITGTWVPV